MTKNKSLSGQSMSPLALFTFLINAERHLCETTGRDGGEKSKQPSLRGKRRKREPVDKE